MIVPADYTTLDYVRRTLMQRNIDSDTSDDPLIIEFIRGASGFMAAKTNRTFVPYVKTYKFDFDRATRIWVKPFDLLEVTELLNGDGVSIDLNRIRYLPRNVYPKFRIELIGSSGDLFVYQDDWQEAIQVTGIWGFHDGYPNIWVDTLELVPSGGLDAADLEMVVVSDPDALDSEGRQRFETRQYLKIDDEVMQVNQVLIGDDYQLSLARGLLGTTAEVHAEDTPIYRYRHVEAIELMCCRIVLWLYQHRDTSGGAISLLQGMVKLKDQTLKDVYEQLGTYEAPTILVARGS